MKKVVFSKRAYLSVLAETYEHISTETGAILLGHRVANTWYVAESVEPGPKSMFTPTRFEYDEQYVTYRANKLSRLYKRSLKLLGLWHRHPGTMKEFSSTDDVTNKTYADKLGGAVSGLVTLGCGFELTMYYVPSNCEYEQIEWTVNDALFPKDYLSYYDTAYYETILNKSAGIGTKQITSTKMDLKQDSCKKPAVTAGKKKSGIIASMASIRERILAMFGIDSSKEEKQSSKHEKQAQGGTPDHKDKIQKDINMILDALDKEIAYVQGLEKVEMVFDKKTDPSGQIYLILKIQDERDKPYHESSLFFYVQNKQVMVCQQNGVSQRYDGRRLSALLGGKHG